MAGDPWLCPPRPVTGIRTRAPRAALGDTMGSSPPHPWASLAAPTVKNLPAMKKTWFDPWVGKIPWRREWLPTPVFLPGEFHGQRSLSMGSQTVRHD